MSTISLNCPLPAETSPNTVKLSHGSGGVEMHRLIDNMTKDFYPSDQWQNTRRDGATFKLGDQQLVFATDAFTVTPLFFPGGNIGKIAFCGTVNDLAVMGATPIGLSLSVVIEEGFSQTKLADIMNTISTLSKETGVPIVTGDTKVMEKKSLDQIILTTSGVGLAKRVFDVPLELGDQIIVSGGIGEHGAALLATRFEMMTELVSDSKPLMEELAAINQYVKVAQDITRGGLAAVLNELKDQCHLGMLIQEPRIPIKPEVEQITGMLWLEAVHLACEGRFLTIVSKKHADKVVKLLQKFNSLACVIGEVTNDLHVVAQTKFGKKLLSMPSGTLVPRIC